MDKARAQEKILRTHLLGWQLISNNVCKDSQGIEGRNSPIDISVTLVPHTPIEMATIGLFMFQMAKLEVPMSICFGKIVVVRKPEKTDMRSITNSEPEPRPSTPKS
jgi:hypothetical protein